MPLSINAATSGSIHAIMENLVASPPASLPFPVKGMSKRRWMVDTDSGPIVQLECLDDPGQAIVFAIDPVTVRNGQKRQVASCRMRTRLGLWVANG